ncbi:hypothetical protein DYB26_002165 [Aphanomyces astaci]|uniref:Uncharacterized protein n=2 Tax=Aphanomyces astaci TaxID=112090 RepID=A0A3R7BEN2_APHAT|nr:hypothetical protein DYB34_002320 [Aphanomyces astaci]RHZ26633.1 hypothetical protein DYB26_002165 [Aphanomyces astaci]
MHFTRKTVSGEGEKVDVVALQQRDLAGTPVFQYVMTNNAVELMKYLVHNDSQLNSRDSVGATPLLIAFLYMNFDLGKQVIMAYPGIIIHTSTCCIYLAQFMHACSVSKGFPYALASYDARDANNPSPYQGENILHIAIVHRKLEIVKWLVETLPDLLDAETTGVFFSPGHACYFGGSPLLFALSSRQLEAAACILQAADRAPSTSRAARTSIFMMDAHGNNALHMAVVHDLPDAFDFAVRHAMARFPNACPKSFDANDATTPYDLPLFMKQLHGTDKDHFERFIRKHNTDYLSPLTLAAAMGRSRMFKHILKSLSVKSWTYGPVTSMMIPLKGLEERARRHRPKKPHASKGGGAVRPTTAEVPSTETSSHPRLDPIQASWWHRVLERRNVRTAVECLGSNSPLSICIDPKTLKDVMRHRLEMIDTFEVKMVLDKKWEFAGRHLFTFNFRRHVLFCSAFTASTFFTRHYRDDGVNLDWTTAWPHVVLECVVVGEMIYRVYYEFKQIKKNGIAGYLEDTGAGMVDNVLKLSFCVLVALAVVFRLSSNFVSEDACVSLALLATYFYFFFFLLGFRSTGPFIVMVLRMLVVDVGRFVVIYFFVLTGFGISLYVIVDQRAGVSAWFQRMKSLSLASFCSTFAWSDFQTINVMQLSQLSELLVFTYLFMVAVVFLNLLIATMGNTYESIIEASEQQWYAERANIMSSMEITLSKTTRESNRMRYAVELEGERYLQVEYVDSDAWLGVQEHDLHATFHDFKTAVAEFRAKKAANRDDGDESAAIQNRIDARIHELHDVLFPQ